MSVPNRVDIVSKQNCPVIVRHISVFYCLEYHCIIFRITRDIALKQFLSLPSHSLYVCRRQFIVYFIHGTHDDGNSFALAQVAEIS